MRIFSKDNDKYSGRRSNRYESNDRVRSNRFGSDRGPVTMHDAVCDECGKECQVPFRPSGEKPIYCSSCFEKQGNGIPRRNSRDSRGSERDFQDKEMFSAVCDDCGKNCQVPFRPSSGKPIYCSDCFEKRGNSHDRESSGRSNQAPSVDLSEINAKLDKIIALIESKSEEKVVKKKLLNLRRKLKKLQKSNLSQRYI